MKKAFKISNIVLSFIVAGGLGVAFGLDLKLGVIGSIILAYFLWSWWWGLQLIWGRRLKGDISQTTYGGFAAFYMAPFIGMLGGAIYKFIKYVRAKPT